jgi:hypothetical protein
LVTLTVGPDPLNLPFFFGDFDVLSWICPWVDKGALVAAKYLDIELGVGRRGPMAA